MRFNNQYKSNFIKYLWKALKDGSMNKIYNPPPAPPGRGVVTLKQQSAMFLFYSLTMRKYLYKLNYLN